jgi:hypothetical protein
VIEEQAVTSRASVDFDIVEVQGFHISQAFRTLHGSYQNYEIRRVSLAQAGSWERMPGLPLLVE